MPRCKPRGRTSLAPSPTSSRPGLTCIFCGINPGRVSAAAAAHFANPRNDFWRLLHDAGFTPRLLEPQEQFALLELGFGVTNAALPHDAGSGDLRRGDFDGARLERIAARARSRVAIAFVGKEAYRGTFGERPELGPQCRTLGPTALYVLPSTSPANAAVPYAERLHWFRALREWLEPARAKRSARCVVDADRADPARPVPRTRSRRDVVGHAGRRHRGGRGPRGGAPARAREEIGLTSSSSARSSGSTSARFPWARRLLHQHERLLPRARRRARAAPTIDLAEEGVADYRWWTLDELAATTERLAPPDFARARAYDPTRVTAVLVVVHLLAATVWVGGSTALVFVGVPAIRTLEGEPRGRAMKELGLRWRPLGYGALLVAGVTGVALAARDWESSAAFQIVFWVKVALVDLPRHRLVPAQLRARPAAPGGDPRGAASRRPRRPSSSSAGSATG